MALEDFFTLTELKDGLTIAKRVEDLVNALQKDKHCVLKNVCEATRQWCTVASTIAVTENKECLDLFVQLGGLWFFNKWLEDAQMFDGATTCDSFVDETIVLVLRALQGLNIDKGNLFSSGIWISVKNLLTHSCAKVQDRARALFDSWKVVNGSVEACKVDGSALDSDKSANIANDVNLPARSVDGIQVKEVRKIHRETSSTQANSVDSVEHADTKKVASVEAVASASTQNPGQEIVPFNEVSPIDQSKRTTSTEKCTSSDVKPGSNEEKSNPQMLNVGSISDKPINNVASSPNGVVAGRDSSVEMSPRRSMRQKLDLDLNLNEDDDGGQLSYDPSGPKNRSPSSSPMRPFLRSIDLNGGPSIPYDSADDYPNLSLSSHYERASGDVQVKPVDPVISIMGTKVEVNRNRKEILPKFMLFQDGKSPEAAIDVDLPRFERLQMMNPTLQVTPFYSPGGAPILHRSYQQQQQFMNNMMGAPPLQTNFINLNSNFMIQRGNGDEDGLMQLFPPGPVISVDECSSSRTDLQRPSSSSGLLGKRNESVSDGWESYPFNIKHHQPHWR